MLSLRYARSWQIAGALLLAIVLVVALVPAAWLSPQDPNFPFFMSDKLLHGITFTALALWFSGQYARHSYWRLVTGLLAFGLLIEVTQRMLPYRTAEWMDLLADAAGVAVGMTIALAGSGGWSLRFEESLQNRIG